MYTMSSRMSKWSSLAAGATGAPHLASAASHVEATEAISGGAKGSKSPVMLFGIIAVAVVLMIVVSNQNSDRKVRSKASPQASADVPTVLVAASVSPDSGAPAEDATVQPKYATMVDRYWTANEDLSSAIQPYAEASDGHTFQDYQKAFMNGREMPVLDRPEQSNVALLLDQLKPMKALIKKSGLSIQQYVEAHNMQVPEAVIELWNREATEERKYREAIVKPDCSEDEAAMLARESLQIVPRAGLDAAILVMREILAARTEATKVGLQLPEMPAEQLESIQFWTTHDGPCGHLAKMILSRI